MPALTKHIKHATKSPAIKDKNIFENSESWKLLKRLKTNNSASKLKLVSSTLNPVTMSLVFKSPMISTRKKNKTSQDFSIATKSDPLLDLKKSEINKKAIKSFVLMKEDIGMVKTKTSIDQ